MSYEELSVLLVNYVKHLGNLSQLSVQEGGAQEVCCTKLELWVPRHYFKLAWEQR